MMHNNNRTMNYHQVPADRRNGSTPTRPLAGSTYQIWHTTDKTITSI